MGAQPQTYREAPKCFLELHHLYLVFLWIGALALSNFTRIGQASLPCERTLQTSYRHASTNILSFK